MSDPKRCPDCGTPNPEGAEACSACGFPLSPPAEAPVSSTEPVILPPRPRRRRPPRPATQAVSLWLVFGTFMAVVVIFVAVKSNMDRVQPAVEGASPQQQLNADSLRMVLEKDSTDTHTRVHLADILYDTGNWSEAIVHYRSAVHHDSSLVNAIVDLGVCYYNLGDAPEAERHFLLALDRNPQQPIALFNLGIVFERRDNPQRALEYYHRALQTDPPPEMKQALVEAINRMQQKTGAQPKPLGGG